MTAGRDETREAFLEAGVRLYGTLASGLLRALTAGAVATEAGYRRQTFYRYWDTQADYVRDLLRHLLSDHEPAADGMAVLPARRGATGDWEDLVRDIARYDYRRMADDERVTMRIGLASMRVEDVDGLGDEAQDFFDTVMDRLGVVFHTALQEQGRRPRGGLAHRDLARVQQALLVGLIMQDLGAASTPSGADLYEEIFGWILDAMTESIA